MTLVLNRLAVTIGGRRLLPPTSTEVSSGRMLALVGASGSGKTTVIGVLAGLVPPAEGEVLLDRVPTSEVSRRSIGMVTQPVVLASTLTVAENVGLPLQAAGRHRDIVSEDTTIRLRQLHLHGVAERLPAHLSGGQRQRAAVARAVIAHPALILADEPTSELDAENRGRVLALLRAAAAEGATVIVATHDPEVADACDERLELAAAYV